MKSNTVNEIVFEADEEQLKMINELKDTNISLGEIYEIVFLEMFSKIDSARSFALTTFVLEKNSLWG